MPKFEVFVENKEEVSKETETRSRNDRKALGCINNTLVDNKIKSTKTKSFTRKQHKKKLHQQEECMEVDRSGKRGEGLSRAEGVVRREEKDYFIECGYHGAAVENMRRLENTQLIRSNYMSKQQELSHHMRSVLIDWLVEVSSQFRCAPEVVFVAVNYLDRFLSQMAVMKCRLQLLGLTCLNIAWKYEDANSRPHLNELIYCTDNACTYQEVVTMEELVVKALNFRLTTATPLHFLTSFLSHLPMPPSSTYTAKHLLETSLLDGACSTKHKPSLLASSCLFVVTSDLQDIHSNCSLSSLTGYGVEEMQGCVRDLLKLQRRLPLHEFPSVDHKYQNATSGQS